MPMCDRPLVFHDVVRRLAAVKQPGWQIGRLCDEVRSARAKICDLPLWTCSILETDCGLRDQDHCVMPTFGRPSSQQSSLRLTMQKLPSLGCAASPSEPLDASVSYRTPRVSCHRKSFKIFASQIALDRLKFVVPVLASSIVCRLPHGQRIYCQKVFNSSANTPCCRGVVPNGMF